ncbi:protein WALLS ARE THIN 1-like [Camellia sinensis]|uniref:protein WALLS ARE THIN 1-like n=1 Tax=Camellia sinensis TaxID=4442 RepID=UPI00103654BF|nr:protein WALLS ARE THIN 1-like [Camellia sinensis]
MITDIRWGEDRGKALISIIGFSSVHVSEHVGFVGSIWLLWNNSEIHCNILAKSLQEVHAWIQLVLQAPVVKKYPARLSVTSYQCFFGVIQFLVIAAFIERDPQAWLVHSAGELFSVAYAGIVASGIAFAVQIWCIDRGGSVFVAVYQPVQTLVVAIMASLALGEEFYLGGIIGAVLIIAGLYFVLWGKNEQRKGNPRVQRRVWIDERKSGIQRL